MSKPHWFDEMVTEQGKEVLKTVMPFGKYKGLTIAQILLKQPHYFYGFINSEIVKQDTSLAKAIRLGGRLGERLYWDNLEASTYPSSQADAEYGEDWLN